MVKIMKNVKGWWLPDSDNHFEHYIADGEYQKIHRATILNYIKNHTKEFNNVIDVGSHVGFWSKDFTELFKHVYAFEPINEVRECYIKNIIKDNYTLYPYGLGSVKNKVKIQYDPNETGNTFITSTGNREIEVYTLDQFEFNKIDYIKIDAEGYEIEVCKGAVKLIEKDKPFIHIEKKKKVMNKTGLTEDIIYNFFKSINYKEVLAIKSEVVYAPE
jgi:FkbM family methyltransferase